MEEWIKVIILGIVEGVTEFLPVSSTGHLIVSAWLLDLDSALSGTFEIFIQIGAVVAVVLLYRAQIVEQVRSVNHDRGVQRFWLGIVLAFVPAAVLGFLLADTVKEVLFSPVVVAVSLILGGVAFLLLERWPWLQQRANTTQLTGVTLRQALAVGILQTLALVPGVSRSGASIIGGMLAGLDRRTATQFSFYLAIPTLGGATVYELLRSLDSINPQELFYLLLGAVVSGVVAWFSIRWLLNYISRNTFIPFGYYRIIVGLLILLLYATLPPVS